MTEYKVTWKSKPESERQILAKYSREAGRIFIKEYGEDFPSEEDAIVQVSWVHRGKTKTDGYFGSDLAADLKPLSRKTETPVARSKDEGYLEQLDEINRRLKYIHWALLGGFGFIILCALGVIKIGFVATWWAY